MKTKRNEFNKLLSVLLVLSLFVWLFPTNVLATEDSATTEKIEFSEPGTYTFDEQGNLIYSTFDNNETIDSSTPESKEDTESHNIQEPMESSNDKTELVYDKLLNTESLGEFFVILNNENALDEVLAFTYEEIETLSAKVNNLYNAIDNPTPEDEAYKTDLLDALSFLPNSGNEFDEPMAMYPADGVITVTAISGAVTWNLTRNCTLNNTVRIPSGATLTINGAGYSITRNFANPYNVGYNSMFQVEAGGTLIIKNTVINGNNVAANTPAIMVFAGTINFDKVTLKNCKNSGASRFGGVLGFGTGYSYVTVSATISNSTIQNCVGGEGSAIIMRDYCQGSILLKGTTITNCTSDGNYGGTIRTQGSADCKLTIDSCTIANNTSSYNGGGVYWNARGANAKLTIQNNTKIQNNKAINGGGIFLSGSSITIVNTEISNNQATYGAGICMQLYDYSGITTGKGTSLELGNNAKILNNGTGDTYTTEYGGGVFMQIDSGSTDDGEDIIITIQPGATIQGNKAKYGGGMAVTQKTGNSSAGDTCADRKYNAYININGGTIGGNTASQMNEASVHGGALYISRTYTNAANYALEVNIADGAIVGNKAISDGGAIYLTDTSNQAKVTVRGGIIGNADTSSTITNSAANGGAFYISGGSCTIHDGTMVNNRATQKGGAIYITTGNFVMYGGSIINNAATNGGGISVNGGNITIHNGALSGNTASNNGGAMDISTSSMNLVINIYDGIITNNEAQNHGGAIEASAAGSCSITLNIGLESCKGVNCNAHSDGTCPEINNNTAAKLGGAFCLHGTAQKLYVNIYCGYVKGNIAIRNPGSNTLNQGGGHVVVWGGEIDPGLMVGGGIYDDHRLDGEQIVIRFWANYEGGPTEPVAIEVTFGVTLVFPLDTYIWAGHELTGWASAPDSTGLYVPTNGQYTIVSSNNGYLDFYATWDKITTYIVYIPDTLPIDYESQAGAMDITAELNYFKTSSNLDIHVESDFILSNTGNTLHAPYTITSSQFGNTVITSGDAVATFRYNNPNGKTVTAKLDEGQIFIYSDPLRDTLTFTVKYYEQEEE